MMANVGLLFLTLFACGHFSPTAAYRASSPCDPSIRRTLARAVARPVNASFAQTEEQTSGGLLGSCAASVDGASERKGWLHSNCKCPRGHFIDGEDEACQDRGRYFDLMKVADKGCRCVQTKGAVCKAISATQASKENALNIILVPSGFNGDMVRFEKIAKWVYSFFGQYPPLDAENNEGLNVWMVPAELKEDRGSMCWFGCQGIDRLLCCSHEVYNEHATTHCGAGFFKNVIVVHNSLKYGGAGVIGAGLAVTSIQHKSPLIAVHELGHSLFGLSDEYRESAHDADETMNCDREGCSKWKDLIDTGRFNVQCQHGGCKGRQWYVSRKTIMDSFDYDFGAVNERISCCKYHFHNAALPAYCAKFSEYGLNLANFCYANVWNSNTPSSLLEGGTLSGTQRMIRAAEDPQGDQYTYVDKPVQWHLVRSEEAGRWLCTLVHELPPGLYLTETVVGDTVDSGTSVLKILVDVMDAHGSSTRSLPFYVKERVEVPPGPDHEMHESVFVERESITVILREDEQCGLRGREHS